MIGFSHVFDEMSYELATSVAILLLFRENEAAMIEQIANDISHKLNKFAGPSSETP